MLYCHRLEILNFWTQSATFSLFTGSGKWCRQFWILSIHQPKRERQPALSSTSLSHFVVFVSCSNVLIGNELDITYTWWRCNNAWSITDATFTKSQKKRKSVFKRNIVSKMPQSLNTINNSWCCLWTSRIKLTLNWSTEKFLCPTWRFLG